ncbi:murein transglycosylase [Neokomagataea tanensis]|uniref:Murein transglycosylase n=1 Tax=Neokomagataea tanensis TaxID=661191 RepID=A0A4Y6VBP9_9PROT|nr:murein transglycosylase [Neokomagataea tanensis]
MPSPTHTDRLKSQKFSVIRYGVAFGAIGLLAACADQADVSPSGTPLPVIQEAEHYQAHAKSYYAPPGPPSDPWGPYIHEASDRFDVPERWIRAVIERESGGRLFDSSGHFTTSVPGAMGLMQLMPPTYDDLRYQYSLNDDPYDPHDNILAGTAYIRQMYDIYGSPGFLAAYNDGPGSLDSYLRRGRALPRETRRYVASIGPKIAGYWPHNRSAADLLVSQHDPNTRSSAADDDNSDDAPATTPSGGGNQSVSAAWAQREQTAQNDAQPAQTAVVPTAAPANTPSDVRAAWAARGIHAAPQPTPTAPHVNAPPPQQTDDNSISDNRVTAQMLPVGHRLKAQSIVAEVPASGIHYKLAPIPHAANPAPASPAPARGLWAIQVGAYGSPAQAHTAANNAKKSSSLSAASYANVQVSPTHTARGALYRARITGLSHEAAEAACQRLQSHSACVVVPPETF